MKIATQFSNTLTLLLLVVNSMSCVQIESGQVGIVPVNSNMSTTTKFDEIAGALTSESNSIWKVSVRRNQFQRKISEYFFLDKKNAWAFGDLLFSTKDGGVSWKAVAINKPSNAKITKVIFTSETTGWLIVQTVEANVVNGKANNFFLLETRDGGKSWRQIIDETGVVVRDFNVVENNIGWIVGIKYLSVEMSRFEVFMMVSTNGGKYWSNISKSLILAIRAEGGQENENISTITYSRDGKILVASTGDKIFQTSDLGNTWTLYETIPKNELDASTIG